MFNLNLKEFLDFRNDPIIAVDISPSSIKVLWLSQINETWYVENFGHAFLPKGVIEGAFIKNIPVFSQILNSVFVSLQIKSHKVSVALPDSAVIAKTIQVNEGLTDAEMEELISIESENYIPYPIEEVNFDFQVIGQPQKSGALLDVLLVATRKENVQALFEAFEEAELEIKIIDVESYAFERALPLIVEDKHDSSDPNGLILVFDLGAMYSRLYVISDGLVVFVREEEFGGNQLWEMAATQYEKAATTIHEDWRAGKVPEDFNEKILKPFSDTLATQLNRTIDFFFSVSHFGEANHLYLAGGMANIPGLVSLVEAKTKIPTSLCNPFANMSFSPQIDKAYLQAHATAWVGTCGLAMRYK